MAEYNLIATDRFYGIETDVYENSKQEMFMTAKQLGECLGYVEPVIAVNKLVKRNSYLENCEFSVLTKLVSTDGKLYDTRLFTEDGIYEATFLSKTKRAMEFRVWVRVLLKKLRSGELQINSSQYITELKESIAILQNQLLALSPVLNQKKINIWKSKVIKPNISMLAQKYDIDERAAYDLVYDRMSSRYGFDRSCAISEFCDKYKSENCYVTDAIADYEPYRKYFLDCAYELLGYDTLKTAYENIDPQKVKYNKKFNKIIEILAKKNNDKTACGIGTLGKVYKTMMSDSEWKQMMSQEHCHSKKQLILNDKKMFDDFKSTVLSMLGGDKV